ncbi:transcriptional regulator [Pseudomonas mosselii]|uniref:Transcriptional regulator n=1 Tax=Pseudomonas mosselii TaxID=78327 RepID=A0A7W2JZS3_9PSED|nr:transcriptional regulator [Pseudomonas mosselii]
MYRWHLITHNHRELGLVKRRLDVLGVEFYSPEMRAYKSRADCNSLRITEKPLFPGYLFVRLDPEQVHPSTISEIPGVKEFVKFGGPIIIVPSNLIAAIKQSLLIRTDQKIKSIECRNVPSAVHSVLSEIALMKSKVDRQVAFLALLQNQPDLTEKAARPYSRIVSVTEVPPVNEKLG